VAVAGASASGDPHSQNLLHLTLPAGCDNRGHGSGRESFAVHWRADVARAGVTRYISGMDGHAFTAWGRQAANRAGAGIT